MSSGAGYTTAVVSTGTVLDIGRRALEIVSYKILVSDCMEFMRIIKNAREAAAQVRTGRSRVCYNTKRRPILFPRDRT